MATEDTPPQPGRGSGELTGFPGSPGSPHTQSEKWGIKDSQFYSKFRPVDPTPQGHQGHPHNTTEDTPLPQTRKWFRRAYRVPRSAEAIRAPGLPQHLSALIIFASVSVPYLSPILDVFSLLPNREHKPALNRKYAR